MAQTPLFGHYEQTEIVRRKLVSLDDVIGLSEDNGRLKVLNVGSYDITHAGQYNTLYFSKNLLELSKKFFGDYDDLRCFGSKSKPENVYLLVALNSNESYRRLNTEFSRIEKQKISTHDERERIWQLANLECVDGIVLFDELDAKKVISAYRPNFLTKGGDYVLEPKDATDERPAVNQEEKNLVESLGGKVLLMPLGADNEGGPYHSYHHFVERILKNHGNH
jgi:glycerol-3-phosphate cytidylyltransferase-like family protein